MWWFLKLTTIYPSKSSKKISTVKIYTCDLCKGTFESDWPPEDAIAECKENFGVDPLEEDSAEVCDDCYNEVILNNGIDRFWRLRNN